MRQGLARDFVGYGCHPPNPRWPGGARVALNIVLNYEEGSEPSVPDGDGSSETGLIDASGGMQTRDLAAESMFEYGSRVGVWRLLRILREHAVPATMFACAVALERNPELVGAIEAAGLDICCHGRRWIRHAELTEAEERREIAEAVAILTRLTGAPPPGWYCRYAPSVNTRRLLVDHGGFLYDSDAYNDELPYWTRVGETPHLVVPYTLVNNDARFIRGALATADDFFAFLKDALDLLYREGAETPKMMSVGLHMRLTGHPGRAVALERFLEYAQSLAGVWICRRLDIARHWHACHPPA
ncbi:MAG TPA: allantoinase PuuE [Acetobacteraceae bacterium]